MAKKSKPKSNLERKSLFEDGVVDSNEKLARLAALAAIRGLASGEQVTLLRSVGFTTQEVARLLLISENQVSVSINQAKNSLKKGVKPKYLTGKSIGEV